MVRNYLKMAWRVLRKQRLHSTINITGLAVGLATTMLLLLWMNDELSYNRFHPKHEQIVKIMLNITSDSQETQTYGSVAVPVADALKREVPGVLQTTCSWEQKALFTYKEITSEESGLVADPAFLEVFNFPLLKGDKATVLQAPNTIVVTQQVVEKYFGSDNPIGKTIRLDQATNYKVVGVLANVPGNSSLQFDYLLPMPTPAEAGSWLEIKASVFAVVAPNTNLGLLQTQMKTMTKKHLPEWLTGWEYFSYKLDDWYLRGNFENGQYAGGGRITYVQLFGIVAVFVLLIAAINFMNLSTARATGRAKEVGVRKAVGAGKWSLIGQFLGESFLLTAIAGLLALIVVVVTLPIFNELLQKRISIDWGQPLYWISYIGVLFLTSLLAGLYPAFVLSAFKPVRVLNGLRERAAGGVLWLRKALVVVQFTAAGMLLVGTGVVYQQINFIQHRNLGYQKQNLIRFEAKGLNQPESYEHAKTILSTVPGVEAVSSSNASFQGTFGRNYVTWEKQATPEKAMFAVLNGDHDLMTTLKLHMQSGRSFSSQFSTDSASVLINEAAARRMKLNNPLTQTIRVNNAPYRIIGVVKDFHIASVHQPIEPTVILYHLQKINYFFARLVENDRTNTLRQLETAYQSLRPGFPFNFQFVDKEYERVYKSELQIGTLANWFSVIAIFISCLGLFGLASFSVERRTKEIGIRKVLGATAFGIFTLITREFLFLVLIALTLSAYPVWYVMNGWLSKFAYHDPIQVSIFVWVGLLSVGIALLTVSLQSIRATLVNPVKSLRTD